MVGKNEDSVKKLVGILIEVLHGEYSDTRDLAVVQLSILSEKAVPYLSAYLEDEADKENDMIKYFELYKDWCVKQGKSRQDEGNFRNIYIREWDAGLAKEKMKHQKSLEKSRRAEAESLKLWADFAKILIKKWNITDTYFFDDSDDASPQYVSSTIENVCGGIHRRTAIDGVLKALSIIGDQKVIPLLQRLPVYQFPYENESLKPVFENAKETIALIQNSQK
ncbi:MAG: hypothetical protein ABSF44_06040 [Candidatus Bathyarchaeia archaeon]|jgi:hypothetical protein